MVAIRSREEGMRNGSNLIRFNLTEVAPNLGTVCCTVAFNKGWQCKLPQGDDRERLYQLKTEAPWVTSHSLFRARSFDRPNARKETNATRFVECIFSGADLGADCAFDSTMQSGGDWSQNVKGRRHNKSSDGQTV
jgi:hypothetical protein